MSTEGISAAKLEETAGLSLSEMFQKSMDSRNNEESTGTNGTEVSSETEAAESNEQADAISPTDAYEQLLAEDEEKETSSADEGSEESDNESEADNTLSTKSLEDSIDSPNGDIEEVRVKGSDGKRTTLKIDYSDKKATKDAHIKAAGMRKFQRERDELVKVNKSISTDLETIKNDYKPLEDAFSEGGVESVVRLLGGEEAWEEAVNKTLEHREYVSNLSAEEKYSLKMDEERTKQEATISAANKRYEALETSVREREEVAELRALESKLHPAFDRYRFAGKLSDPVAENQLDNTIWSTVQQKLSDYPEEVELTQAIIDKEFRSAAANLNKVIKMQTERKVKKTIENKKLDTARRAKVAAKKGLSGTSKEKEVIRAAMSGDLSGALKNLWSK